MDYRTAIIDLANENATKFADGVYTNIRRSTNELDSFVNKVEEITNQLKSLTAEANSALFNLKDMTISSTINKDDIIDFEDSVVVNTKIDELYEENAKLILENAQLKHDLETISKIQSSDNETETITELNNIIVTSHQYIIKAICKLREIQLEKLDDVDDVNRLRKIFKYLNEASLCLTTI